MLLGVDTGGTFTDFVLYADGALRVHKVLSTPDAPERAILAGIRDLGLDPARLSLVHGSTVATNAVLERKGVPTAYITNRGLADVLTLGRQARPDLYELEPCPPPPPVPPELCHETGGRLDARGNPVEPLTGADLDALCAWLDEVRPRAVAVNLLFSYLDDRFERAIAERLAGREDLFVSPGSAVLPEYGEYERGMAAFLNAYVGPLVQGYLDRLAGALAPASVAVMQSSGETVAADQAGRHAVNLLLSGPAGGLQGARHLAGLGGWERLLSFDMGGTSTDVALLDGGVRLTRDGQIGGWPVAVPMVDMHTIGAGGGSIARVDAGGLLQVGPESAGADPGPACYGRGGTLATVTDANLVLGRLRPDAFLGGDMALDTAAAERAVDTVAEGLGMDRIGAALGIVGLANEHMARALRVISVQRGLDPRDFVLVSFGGAGGLHVCALAEALHMARALVPLHAGVLSALGMLAAPRGRQRSRTLARPLAACTTAEIEAAFASLAEGARAELVAEGVAAADLRERRSVDLRYRGQSYSLNLPWAGLQGLAEAFHALHAQRYGHRLEAPVELVNVRLGLQGPVPELPLAGPRKGAPAPERVVRLPDTGANARVLERGALGVGARVGGPALIVERVATTFVAPGWSATVDAVGNLRLERD